MAIKKTSTRKVATKKAATQETPSEAVTAKAEKPATTKKVVKRATKKSASVNTTKKGTTRSPSITSVVAKVDVGFGNHLYIRGESAGLSWESGLLMECVGDSEWVWSTDKAFSNFEFKLVINDNEHSWSEGENFVARAGAKTVVEPTF